MIIKKNNFGDGGSGDPVGVRVDVNEELKVLYNVHKGIV